eukprot:TRINITY_DN5090_c2_g1_i10.p4 TRINITY_DN5090_c2_g1~~TRINITY_DN5090_c2_g1_i10.p4  ORF type:complete len:117 (+),score=10.40 TRINITY_DN5090_c2_g1_i10:221-571(+)
MTAILQTFALGLGIPLELGLCMLLAWHLYLIVYNKTTIEYHEGVTGRLRASKSGLKYQHPYDLGFCANLHAIFGQNAPQWCMPGCSLEGEGTWYPTAVDKALSLQDNDVEVGRSTS